MKIRTVTGLLCAVPFFLFAQSDSLDLYLLPGQGGDHRLFDNFAPDGPYRLRHIRYHRPQQGQTMREYARELCQQIDTTRRFALIGVSLGGMFATEMSTLLPDERTVVISSAKNRTELPAQYRFQRRVPIYKLVPPRVALFGAKVLQPIVEPDRRREAATFKAMLRDKDPIFLRRTIQMIMQWERTETPDGVYAIHGGRDHTIPLRNLEYDFLMHDGSHMIVLTRGPEVSRLVEFALMDDRDW